MFLNKLSSLPILRKLFGVGLMINEREKKIYGLSLSHPKVVLLSFHNCIKNAKNIGLAFFK